MPHAYHYDETASTKQSVSEIHAAWQWVRDVSSSGKKAWLTQMKNHYARIIKADPEAAAELLAIHEYKGGSKDPATSKGK